jgi:hypothetical protein
MTISEAAVLPKIRLALSRAGAVMFRNNIGLAWYGEKRDQPVKYGLGEGTGDLIGWVTVEVTPDMVGQRLAVFSSIEVKRPIGGRATKEQENFILVVRAAGGYAGVARSPEEAVAIIKS